MAFSFTGTKIGFSLTHEIDVTTTIWQNIRNECQKLVDTLVEISIVSRDKGSQLLFVYWLEWIAELLDAPV